MDTTLLIDVNSIVDAIDNNNFSEIEKLRYNKKDIILELYNNELLTSERLTFIIKKYNNYFNISSNLIKKLMKDKNEDLLDIIFSNLKFYDNTLILKLLLYYKNKTGLSTEQLKNNLSNEKFKILDHKENDYGKEEGVDKYLIYECFKDDINRYIIKYLIEHGANINKEDMDGNIPLSNIFHTKLKRKIVYKDNCVIIVEKSRCVDMAIVKYLVEHGTDINKENKNGETPLHFAIRLRIERLVKYLVEHGADIHKENKKGFSPLLTFCSGTSHDEIEEEAIIKYLVEHGADINKKNKEGKTSLMVACEKGNEVLVKYLVEYGGDINVKMEEEYFEIYYHSDKYYYNITPLDFSFTGGNENIVKYLVDHGADINKENKNGETPLFNACIIGNKAVVKWLVEHGADMNKENKDGETPFFYACYCHYTRKGFFSSYMVSGDKVLVEYLIEHGADINKENKNGETPLIRACQCLYRIIHETYVIGDIEIIKLLVEHGADVNKTNHKGETPLFCVCNLYISHLSRSREEIINGLIEIIKYLIEHGADINKEDKDGRSPLFIACKNQNGEIVKYLVEHGANVNGIDLYESESESESDSDYLYSRYD